MLCIILCIMNQSIMELDGYDTENIYPGGAFCKVCKYTLQILFDDSTCVQSLNVRTKVAIYNSHTTKL